MMSFREKSLLELFARNSGCMISDNWLADYLFGDTRNTMRDKGHLSLKQCMSRLRQKLPQDVLLVRVSKRGYALVRRGAT